MLKVTVYTKNDCQPCRLTKMKLDQLGIPFTEVNVEKATFEEGVRRVKDLGYNGVPVVVVSGDWHGFRPGLLAELGDVATHVEAA